MWIDINASVGHWPFKQVQYNTCATLLDRMDRFGIMKAVVANMNGIFYKNTQAANEELFEEIRSDRRFEGRFIPFAVINPIYGGWQEDLDTCTDKYGMKGIRLYPLYHDYELSDPALIDLLQHTRERGLPVAFTLRMVDSRQRSWLDIEREWTLRDVLPILKAVPDAKYLLLNIANGMSISDDEAEIVKKAQVLMDTSGREISNLGELLARYGSEKFGFGSHSPILDPVSSMLRIESLREQEADEKTQDTLRSGNALKFLGI